MKLSRLLPRYHFTGTSQSYKRRHKLKSLKFHYRGIDSLFIWVVMRICVKVCVLFDFENLLLCKNMQNLDTLCLQTAGCSILTVGVAKEYCFAGAWEPQPAPSTSSLTGICLHKGQECCFQTDLPHEMYLCYKDNCPTWTDHNTIWSQFKHLLIIDECRQEEMPWRMSFVPKKIAKSSMRLFKEAKRRPCCWLRHETCEHASSSRCKSWPAASTFRLPSVRGDTSVQNPERKGQVSQPCLFHESPSYHISWLKCGCVDVTIPGTELISSIRIRGNLCYGAQCHCYWWWDWGSQTLQLQSNLEQSPDLHQSTSSTK